MRFKSFIFLILIVVITADICNAQQWNNKPGGNPSISPALLIGSVVDQATNETIEFATVSLFRMPKDTLVGGIITNEKGVFELSISRPGIYKISIAFMGYKTLIIDSLRIKSGEEHNLGTLKLNSNEKVLNAVTVEAQQDIVKNTIDKKVFDAEKLAIANGGSATDVLSQVPTVNVDVDGNISLRGSGNVTILIDGRPSGMTGAGRSGILAGIPASAIETVEVITNPSAKYDPDGMSGIINIILKKNKLQGTNGSATISAGSHNKYNTNVTYNFRKDKINFYSNYSFRYNERKGMSGINRINYIEDTASYMYQNSNSNGVGRNHNAKLGVDFNLNKQITLGGSATLNYDDGTRYVLLENKIKNSKNDLQSAFNRYSKDPSSGITQDYNLNYRQKFNKPGALLTAESNFSANKNQSKSAYEQENKWNNYSEVTPYWNYQNNNTQTLFSINSNMIDFESTLFKNGKIESGLKNTNRTIDNTFFSETYNTAQNSYLPDDSLNNKFIYKEFIYAAYTSFSSSFGKWSYKAGLRAEQAQTDFTLVNNAVSYKNHYFNVFPSAFINRKLNDHSEVQFNYGRRINRPGTQQLSPFTNYSNPLMLRTGNPYLKPEYTHNFELSYLYNFNKINFSTTVFYRKTVDLIMRNILVNQSNQTIVTFANFGTSENTGIETVTRIDLFKWWNVTANINGFNTVIQGTNQDGEINNSNLSWNARFLTNLLIGKGWSVQASGMYNAKNIIAQGTIFPMYGVDIALKKDILKNKGTITLGGTDILNTRRFKVVTNGSNFNQESTHKWETQVFTLTFNYRFGTMEFNSRKNKNKENEYKGDDGTGF